MKTKEEERDECARLAREADVVDVNGDFTDSQIMNAAAGLIAGWRAAAREEMKEAVMEELTKLFNAFLEHPDCAQMFAVAAKKVRDLKTGVEK